MPVELDHERDGARIYRRSFEIIRSEADLSAVPPELEAVVVRMIHACGMVDLVSDVAWSPGVAQAGRAALRAGAPILADAQMVAHGVTRSRLPANNEVLCFLSEPGLAERARAAGLTRSAAAVDQWLPRLEGAVVAIGNAPTALYRLLELLQAGVAPRPAAVLGMPVGFVGAAESKAALESLASVPWLTVRGRRGGSAIVAAAVNALASEDEV